jgi:hypothetical protein
MTQTPDRWLVIRITRENETIFKVLAGWHGSYLGGPSWRVNSGITKVTESPDFYFFEGASGSMYQCHKKAFGANNIMEGILKKISGNEEFTVEVISDKILKQVLIDSNLF